MKTQVRRQISILVLLVLSASFSFAETTVYRGLKAKKNHKAETAPSQFRIDESKTDPSKLELSTFVVEHINDDPCQLGFVINDDGSVQHLAGYTALYTPPPDGHWSIFLPTGKTKEQAKKDFSAYARSDVGQEQMIPEKCRE